MTKSNTTTEVNSHYTTEFSTLSGFGLKHLQKYGFKIGGGLGKNENGVSKHVDVVKKHDTVGLGVKKEDDRVYLTRIVDTYDQLLQKTQDKKEKKKQDKKEKKDKKAKKKEEKKLKKIEKQKKMQEKIVFKKKGVDQVGKEKRIDQEKSNPQVVAHLEHLKKMRDIENHKLKNRAPAIASVRKQSK